MHGHLNVRFFHLADNMGTNISFTAVMGKLFKEGAKGKEKNFRRANIIY